MFQKGVQDALIYQPDLSTMKASVARQVMHRYHIQSFPTLCLRCNVLLVARQEVQAHEVAAARAAIKEAEAEEKLQSGLAELDAVERMARRLLAGMRWRQATILQGSAHKQSLFRLPSARRPCPQPVLQQVLYFPFHPSLAVAMLPKAPLSVSQMTKSLHPSGVSCTNYYHGVP